MGVLGETSDPKALIPGSPNIIEDKVAALRKQGERYAAITDELRGVDVGNWWGQAGEAFWSMFSKEPPKWTAVGDSLASTSGALTEYAGTLRWAQGQAAEAIALWEKGEASTHRAMAQYKETSAQAPFSDPGEQYRRQAQELLTGAREKLDAAGTHAAAAIRGDGTKPGALDHLVDEITGGWSAKGKAEASGPNAGVAAAWPKGSKMGELKAFAELAKASAQGSAGNDYVQLSGKAAATVAAEASLAGQVNNEGIGAKAEVKAGAKASAQGKVDFGPYAGYNGKVEAFVGASASASASVGLDGLKANAGAFAGAKATGKVGGDIGGIGLNVTGEAWAGPGAEPGVRLGPDENGTWHIGANAGVSPIVGGKLGFELTVDPDDVAQTATDAAQFVGNAAANTGEAIDDFATSTYDSLNPWN
ncbi:putative T7SS-secreted protein [Haloactinomyces albus]|uniref:Putative T7SS secretion signal domain-containing protein n=1 Tax=Haloactinomyces albus TaxID=1352928 RepID=A0AAE4CLV5_9ACTN|nr:hypothetical protein [Haloactinomyces albus]MDR7302620.1 hypothetical protein [Haloactinomyces albus]